MLDSAQEKLILGTCFVIAGLVLIVFHKQLRKRDDDWNARVPRFLRSHPGGPILTAMIIIFGALLIYAGIAQISNSLGN